MINHTFKAKKKPTVITICGTDPMGMSGIHADLRALSSMDVHGLCCITATTAQSLNGFSKLNAVSDEVFLTQLDSLLSYEHCNVIKIGLIANINQAKILIEHEIIKDKIIILDPVLAASTADIEDYEKRLAAVLLLLPFATIITPNLIEAKALVNSHDTSTSPQDLAHKVLNLGAAAVLIKGGHSEHKSLDYYCDQNIQFNLQHKEYSHNYSRGTGCAMASLIAASLASGASSADAVVMAKMQMESGWQSPFSISADAGSLGFSKWPSLQDSVIDVAEKSNGSNDSSLTVSLPAVSLPAVFKHADEPSLSFASCRLPLGLYPIVDRAGWLEKLLPLGINIAQLRIKDLAGDDLKQEIIASIKVANKFNCQLFINDYWELAIECGAYGVHLGQEDIDDANLQAISDSGLRLGLSSHCFYEVARAKTINPSYIAFGPVYKTETKDMPWVPQGPAGLSYWRKHLAGIPMVAIGGIHGERFACVKSTGVDAIAMITAITLSQNPVQTTQSYIDMFND
jgi:hydroxymethylpyrimidine kinase/phosphomethylpyrimidine kinase/thiamine-phosphate diphosphorylase